MNRIGSWLDKNMDKFYVEDKTKNKDQNYFLQRKIFDKVWTRAETIIKER